MAAVLLASSALAAEPDGSIAEAPVDAACEPLTDGGEISDASDSDVSEAAQESAGTETQPSSSEAAADPEPEQESSGTDSVAEVGDSAESSGNTDSDSESSQDPAPDGADEEDAPDSAEDSGSSPDLAAPVITAQDASEDENNIWRFDSDANTEEIRFSWDCAAAQTFALVICDEAGEEIYASETSAAELVLPTEQIETDTVYTLTVTAFSDTQSASGTLTFFLAPAAAEEENESSAGEETGAADSESGSEDGSASEETSSADAAENSSSGDKTEKSTGRSSSSGSGSSGKASGKSSSSRSKPSGSSGGSSSRGKRSSSDGSSSSLSESASSDPETETSVSLPQKESEEFDLRTIDILLDGGDTAFETELDGGTLRLISESDTSTWSVGEGVLDLLQENGIETLEFYLSDRVFTLQLSETESDDGTESEATNETLSESGDLESVILPSPGLTIDSDGIKVICSNLYFTLLPG